MAGEVHQLWCAAPFSHPSLIRYFLALTQDVNNQKGKNEVHGWCVVPPQSERRLAFFYLYLLIHLLKYPTVLIHHSTYGKLVLIWKTLFYFYHGGSTSES